jgi:RNA polymerase sigma-70 factor (ECF subfamily)
MEFRIYRANEEELIKGCLRRDRDAQKRLYDTFSPRMYPLCCRYVKDAAEAEDVLVKAFTRILDKIDMFRGQGSLEGWIKRIVINEALDSLRRNRLKFQEIELDAHELYPGYQHNNDPFETEYLLQIIQMLPPGYRTVFNLYAIDGYSHKEIAEQLQISENTSKSQLSRARVFLQNILAQQNHALHNKQHDSTS